MLDTLPSGAAVASQSGEAAAAGGRRSGAVGLHAAALTALTGWGAAGSAAAGRQAGRGARTLASGMCNYATHGRWAAAPAPCSHRLLGWAIYRLPSTTNGGKPNGQQQLWVVTAPCTACMAWHSRGHTHLGRCSGCGGRWVWSHDKDGRHVRARHRWRGHSWQR